MGFEADRQIDPGGLMIGWLMQVVAVAWLGAIVIMLLKVLDDDRALPA